eukprot:COSAG02_NODE_846_length_16565_cov_20.404627_10_plen_60_part_00
MDESQNRVPWPQPEIDQLMKLSADGEKTWVEIAQALGNGDQSSVLSVRSVASTRELDCS